MFLEFFKWSHTRDVFYVLRVRKNFVLSDSKVYRIIKDGQVSIMVIWFMLVRISRVCATVNIFIRISISILLIYDIGNRLSLLSCLFVTLFVLFAESCPFTLLSNVSYQLIQLISSSWSWIKSWIKSFCNLHE